MQRPGKIPDSYGKSRLLFNLLILILSLSSMLFIIFVWHWNGMVTVTYVASALVSSLFFYCVKLILLRNVSSDVVTPANSSGGSRNLLVFVAVLVMLVAPLVILFFLPHLWLMVLNGIVSGASISDLILYLGKRKEQNRVS